MTWIQTAEMYLCSLIQIYAVPFVDSERTKIYVSKKKCLYNNDMNSGVAKLMKHVFP